MKNHFEDFKEKCTNAIFEAKKMLHIIDDGDQYKNGWNAAMDESIRTINALPLPAMPSQEDDIKQVYDAFDIGSAARTIDTLMVNLRNTQNFAEKLHAIEREFFMVPCELDSAFMDDDCEPQDECLLNCWGTTTEQYLAQFREALKKIQVMPKQDVCKVCDGKGWIFMGHGNDYQCEACSDHQPDFDPFTYINQVKQQFYKYQISAENNDMDNMMREYASLKELIERKPHATN